MLKLKTKDFCYQFQFKKFNPKKLTKMIFVI